MKTTIVPNCLLGGAIALSLAACGDSDGGNGSSPPDASIVVATNAADASASLDVYSPDLDTLASQFNSGSNEGISFDETGTLYQAGDSGDFTGLRVFANFASRADGSEFVTGFDRQLDGSAALAGGLRAYANRFRGGLSESRAVDLIKTERVEGSAQDGVGVVVGAVLEQEGLLLIRTRHEAQGGHAGRSGLAWTKQHDVRPIARDCDGGIRSKDGPQL